MIIGWRVRFLFVLFCTFILILFYRKSLAYLRILRLKKKIKNNPLIGIKENDGSYYYKEKGYTITYRIKESPTGIKTVKWLSLKRRLGFFEEKIFRIKRGLNNFFLYQRWFSLFRSSVAIIFAASLIIFYWGIKEHTFRRVERFRWVAAQIAGVSPESVEYTGEGWFKISGQRRPKDEEAEPVRIIFNPLAWLFFPNTAEVGLWSKKLDKYVSYPVTVSEQGDVWLRKRKGEIHGSMSGGKIVWDEPQKAGTRDEVSGHRISVEDGKLKIFDE